MKGKSSKSRPSNIIDFGRILKKKQKSMGAAERIGATQLARGSKSAQRAARSNQKNNVIKRFNDLRQAQIQDNRRQVRRTILDGFIGACVVMPSRGLINVSLHDISKTGIAFDMSITQGAFCCGDSVMMRLYMNHDTYFPFEVSVQNLRPLVGTERTRFGARFKAEAFNTTSLQHFVDFIESVTACLKTDKGDTMVSLGH